MNTFTDQEALMSEAVLEPAALTFAEAISKQPVRLDELAPFLAARDGMLLIARRIVGSVPDAEDVVQDAWLRWSRTDRAAVRNPAAFLYSTTTRLALSAIGTAHVRHRSLVHQVTVDMNDPGDGPDAVAIRSDRLRAAMLLLVERLAPREQAAYVLREAFGYPYRDLGDVLALAEATARQLVKRARIRLRAGGLRQASPAERLRLLGAFLQAARTGDSGALADLARSSPSPGPSAWSAGRQDA